VLIESPSLSLSLSLSLFSPSLFLPIYSPIANSYELFLAVALGLAEMKILGELAGCDHRNLSLSLSLPFSFSLPYIYFSIYPVFEIVVRPLARDR
jgi:hypothetical protein